MFPIHIPKKSMTGEVLSLTCNRTTRYVQLLLEHLQQLKGLGASFDKLAPVLQSLGRTEGRSLMMSSDSQLFLRVAIVGIGDVA